MTRLAPERPIVREALALDRANPLDGPVSATSLEAYSAFFLRVLGSVHETLRACATLRACGEACAVFCFGETASLTEAEIRGMLWAAAPEQGRSLRRYDGNTVLIVRSEVASLWTREAGIADADAVFADLVDMGY